METNKNCRKCMHYHITWDKSFPYGCKLFDIKSKQVPSVVVYQSSGKMCEGFEEKASSDKIKNNAE